MFDHHWSWGQRLAIRVLMFAYRRGVRAEQLRMALRRAFPHRNGADREAMLVEAEDRVWPTMGSRIGKH